MGLEFVKAMWKDWGIHDDIYGWKEYMSLVSGL